MFTNIKYTAIAVGLFILVIASVIAFLATLFAYKWLHSEQNQIAAMIYITVLFIVRIVGYLAAGYISAKLAETQPLLHGFICGCLGVIFTTFFGGNLFLGFFICLPTVITGAWLLKRKEHVNSINL